MPNNKLKRIANMRHTLVTRLSHSHDNIVAITDDQQLRWYAHDALLQASQDLSAILQELREHKSTSVLESIQRRLLIVATTGIRQYIAFLRWLPPQLLVLPVLTLHFAFFAGGLYWLGFTIYAPYWVLASFFIANLIISRCLLHRTDEQVRADLDLIIELPNDIRRIWRDLHRTHPTLEERLGRKPITTNFMEQLQCRHENNIY